MRKRQILKVVKESDDIQPERFPGYKYLGNKTTRGSYAPMGKAGSNNNNNGGGCGCNHNPKQIGNQIKKYQKKSQ